MNSLSLSEERDFHDPETRAALEHPAFQVIFFLALPSTKSMYCFGSGLPPSARISLGTSGYVFEDVLAREETLSHLRKIDESCIFFSQKHET